MKSIQEFLLGNVDNIKANEIILNDSIKFIDLGLPSGILWGSHNLGAKHETEYGHYYLWISDEPMDDKECDWGNGGVSKNTVCVNGKLSPEYDTATKTLGKKYCIPTKEDFKELIKFTEHSVESIKNPKTKTKINGMKFTSKSNPKKYIFIPFSGYKLRYNIELGKKYARLWTSEPYTKTNKIDKVIGLSISHNNNCEFYNFTARCMGFAIRPIKKH